MTEKKYDIAIVDHTLNQFRDYMAKNFGAKALKMSRSEIEAIYRQASYLERYIEPVVDFLIDLYEASGEYEPNQSNQGENEIINTKNMKIITLILLFIITILLLQNFFVILPFEIMVTLNHELNKQLNGEPKW